MRDLNSPSHAIWPGDEWAVDCDGFTVYVDADSVAWLDGAEIDYISPGRRQPTDHQGTEDQGPGSGRIGFAGRTRALGGGERSEPATRPAQGQGGGGTGQRRRRGAVALRRRLQRLRNGRRHPEAGHRENLDGDACLASPRFAMSPTTTPATPRISRATTRPESALTVTKAADIIAALQAARPAPVLERHTRMPYGWGLWLRALKDRLGAIRRDGAETIVDLFAQRPLPAPLPRPLALNRWQAFRSMFYQDWGPPLREDRRLRWLAGSLSPLFHLLFSCCLCSWRWSGRRRRRWRKKKAGCRSKSSARARRKKKVAGRRHRRPLRPLRHRRPPRATFECCLSGSAGLVAAPGGRAGSGATGGASRPCR